MSITHHTAAGNHPAKPQHLPDCLHRYRLILIIALAIFPLYVHSTEDAAFLARPVESGVTIRFGDDRIEISGVLTRCESTATWAEAVQKASPKAAVHCDQLRINPDVTPMPGISRHLEGLLMELALSARGATVRLTPRSLEITGLTDSLVAQSAIQIRLQDLAGNGELEISDTIEVVSTQEMKSRALPLSLFREKTSPSETEELARLATRD